MATFYDLAAANRRKSALLVLLVLGIFAALATAAGVAFTGGIEGALPYSLFAFGLGFCPDAWRLVRRRPCGAGCIRGEAARPERWR